MYNLSGQQAHTQDFCLDRQIALPLLPTQTRVLPSTPSLHTFPFPPLFLPPLISILHTYPSFSFPPKPLPLPFTGVPEYNPKKTNLNFTRPWTPRSPYFGVHT
jgi:hypothetical protein